jgi:hypothetical protein
MEGNAKRLVVVGVHVHEANGRAFGGVEDMCDPSTGEEGRGCGGGAVADVEAGVDLVRIHTGVLQATGRATLTGLALSGSLLYAEHQVT